MNQLGIIFLLVPFFCLCSLLPSYLQFIVVLQVKSIELLIFPAEPRKGILQGTRGMGLTAHDVE